MKWHLHWLCLPSEFHQPSLICTQKHKNLYAMKKSENELQQAIKALMDYYGIEDFNFYHQGAIFISEDDGFSYKLADVLYRGISDYCYNSNLRRELAMLIQLLRSCKDSELTIKGKITHPLKC